MDDRDYGCPYCEHCQDERAKEEAAMQAEAEAEAEAQAQQAEAEQAQAEQDAKTEGPQQ